MAYCRHDIAGKQLRQERKYVARAAAGAHLAGWEDGGYMVGCVVCVLLPRSRELLLQSVRLAAVEDKLACLGDGVGAVHRHGGIGR